MTATAWSAKAKTGSYATIDGLKLYYEVRGTGNPIVIPGGLMTIAMIEPLSRPWRRRVRVITLERQAHGHTSDDDRPLAYEQLEQIIRLP